MPICFQTPIAHDFSPYMHVHSGEIVYKKKIVIGVLFLHPSTHLLFAHLVLLESVLGQAGTVVDAEATAVNGQTRPHSHRRYPLLGVVHTEKANSYSIDNTSGGDKWYRRADAGKGREGALQAEVRMPF